MASSPMRRPENSIVADDPERAVRAIIMLVDSVLGDLYRAGWNRHRDLIEIEQAESVLPMWVTLKKKRVFSVDVELRDGRPGIHGKWLTKRMPRPSVFKRIWRWFQRKLGGSDAGAP